VKLKRSEEYLAYHWQQSENDLSYRRKVVNTAARFAKYINEIIGEIKKLVES